MVFSGSMAGEPGSAAHPMPAPAYIVGNAFVNQYYNVLHQSPHMVHRFYTDESKLSRAEAGPDGAVDIVATVEGIDGKINSMDYGGIRAEIKTVDSLESLEGSVLVMVTGSMYSRFRAKRDFVQTFFLAPQKQGYFVLNDMFRYSDSELQPLQPPSPMANGTSDLDQTTDVSEPGVGEAHAQATTQQEVREYPNSPLEEGLPSEDQYQIPEEEEEDAPEIEDEISEEHPHTELGAAGQEEQFPPVEEANPGEAPKKSYASILRVQNDNSGSPVTAPKTSVHKTSPAQPDRFTSPSEVSQGANPAVGQPNLVSNEPEDGTATDPEGDGRSVYVKNLPLSITSPELEKEFEKFGPLKPGGVNLRNQRVGVCFAFIEFEDSNSAQSAIQASPLSMGGRQVYVEEKRPMPVVSRAGRGRGYQGRGYQSDGMRSRGYFAAGRGSGRGSVQDQERDFNYRGRGGRGSYMGGNTYPSNNYGSNFNAVNGYRRADIQGGNGARAVRRGTGNQIGRGRGLGAE